MSGLAILPPNERSRLRQLRHPMIVVQMAESGIDVNRPTQRSRSRFSHSVWQIYLLWLHDYFYENEWTLRTPHEDADRQSPYLMVDLEANIKILRAFLKYGADPFTFIPSGALEHPRQYLPRTTVQDLPWTTQATTFLSVADVVRDLERITTTSGYGTVLTEASVRKFAASDSTQLSMGSWDLAPSQFSA